MRENLYQARLLKKIKIIFPDCFIMKNDSSYVQGVPDIIILYGDRWAMLEVKTSASTPVEPNQEYWISRLNEMSFAAFVYPDIEEDVLYELQRALDPRG